MTGGRAPDAVSFGAAVPPSTRYDRYDAAAVLLLAGLVVAVLTYGSYGISNDEDRCSSAMAN